MNQSDRKNMIKTIVAIAAVAAAVILFCGKVTVKFEDRQFTVGATLTSSKTIAYEEVESVQLLESYEGGTRIFGIGSPAMQTGKYANSEYGSYSRYTFTSNKQAVEIRTVNGYVLVNGKTAEETEEIFRTLQLHLK